MMFATMLSLSRSDCRALNLRDTYGLHRIVYSLFPAEPDNSRDFLFVEKGGDQRHRRILILSRRRPLDSGYGTMVSKEVPEYFLQHDRYRFEVVLNPVRRNAGTGRLEAVRGRERLLEWFMEKAPGLGFGVACESLQVDHIGVVTYRRNGAVCTHNKATFSGTLAVTQREAFIHSFRNGIGRAKAFGFGLLQLVPIHRQHS